MKSRYIYSFGGGQADGAADMKYLLGGKGANLAEMTNIGLPVPPGFTISTDICHFYFDHERGYPRNFSTEVLKALKKVEKLTNKEFGNPKNPLLVSVRSGAPSSMPGMMDTILNLGLNDMTIRGMMQRSGNERFAFDSYRRLIQMYGDVVMQLKPKTEDDRDPFEVIIDQKRVNAVLSMTQT